MKPDQMTEALESAAAQIGVKVRYEALGPGGVVSGGGVCKVRGEWWVIIDKKASAPERVAILSDALAGMDLADVALPTKVRDLIDKRRQARRGGTPD
jgi:hypothetical protein